MLRETGAWCLYYSVEYINKSHGHYVLCRWDCYVFQSAMSTIRPSTHVAWEFCILVVDSRVVAPSPTTAVPLVAVTGNSSSELIANKLDSNQYASRLSGLLSVYFINSVVTFYLIQLLRCLVLQLLTNKYSTVRH